MKISKFIALSAIFVAAFSFVSCSSDDDDDDNNNDVVADNHEYVDLGLPSGTLWATCNVGASKPEEYGDYFAWGETKTKETFAHENYKWLNGNVYTKYCTHNEEGKVDNKTILDSEDDAATANWGSKWCMPSVKQVEELFDGENTTQKWTTLNGVNGLLITSKKNGNTIFLPATGKCVDGSLEYGDDEGSYWSRSLQMFDNDTASSFGAVAFFIYPNAHIWGNYIRKDGLTVRPVRSSK